MPSAHTDNQSYKKARRQYFKSTKNRNSEIENDWTPFRAAEKRFKARFPPPDLSNVLDLACLDPRRHPEIEAGVWAGRPDTRNYCKFTIDGEKEGYTLPDIPGLVLLPSFFSPEEQRDLVRWSLSEHALPPNVTNLDTHYLLPQQGIWNAFVQDPGLKVSPRPIDSDADFVEQPSGPRQLINNTPASSDNFESLNSVPKPPAAPSPTMQPSTCSELLPKLRWANIGWFYHWGTKQYDFAKGKIAVHDKIRDVCRSAVRSVNWKQVFSSDTSDWGEGGPDWVTWNDTYEPDAGIVNFYQNKDTLMAHVDRSEVCATSPLVSISLGNAAVFLIGGSTRNTEPVPILLRSGDVVIMSGPACRRAYHGVPRILENTLPRHMFGAGAKSDWALFEQYMKTTRININVRQVFPRGFDPGIIV